MSFRECSLLDGATERYRVNNQAAAGSLSFRGHGQHRNAGATANSSSSSSSKKKKQSKQCHDHKQNKSAPKTGMSPANKTEIHQPLAWKQMIKKIGERHHGLHTLHKYNVVYKCCRLTLFIKTPLVNMDSLGKCMPRVNMSSGAPCWLFKSPYLQLRGQQTNAASSAPWNLIWELSEITAMLYCICSGTNKL